MRYKIPGPHLRPRQAELARQMYDQVGDAGKSRWTAAEFGVTRPKIYRYLDAEPTRSVL